VCLHRCAEGEFSEIWNHQRSAHAQ
jgi:hypothetical protein